jgi:hypothetical protein
MILFEFNLYFEDKRDQLVLNFEKENFILNQDKVKTTHKLNENVLFLFYFDYLI